MTDKKTIAAHTLGCKTNQYDTQAMLELFVKAGYRIVEFSETADVYLVNTCTVTSAADKKSRQLLRQAKRDNGSIVIAAGCFSQGNRESILDFCDIALGNKDRADIVNLVNELIEKRENDKNTKINAAYLLDKEYEPLFITAQKDHTRVHMKIQEGCNNSCAYCIIPSVRGEIRSRKLTDIKKEAASLYKNNCKEVVLTGINLSSYGRDQLSSPNLYDVICTIEDTGINRIRLGSIDPGTFLNCPKLLEKPNILCNHFHISLQSGCDKILKAMNRQYFTKDYAKEIAFIRNRYPNCAVTTDIIVGFPGESEEDFEQTYGFTNEIGFARIHVFPFSSRPRTMAAKMNNQILNREKKNRCKKLIALGKTLENDYITSFLGKELEVLFETHIDNINTGHSREYVQVKLNDTENLTNKIVNVRINGYDKNILITAL